MYRDPRQLRITLIALGIILCVMGLAFFGIQNGANAPIGAAWLLMF